MMSDTKFQHAEPNSSHDGGKKLGKCYKEYNDGETRAWRSNFVI